MVSIWPPLVGYVVGSIPFGWWLIRRASGFDLRATGSGNVGASNAVRTTGWRAGIAVALVDVAKGGTAVALIALTGGNLADRAISGVAAIVGHVFPLWLRFRGGKGVATACGVFAVLAPLATAVAAAVFVVILGATRVASLASLTATVALAIGTWQLSYPRTIVLATAVAATVVVVRHRSNVVRLWQGRERRLGA